MVVKIDYPDKAIAYPEIRPLVVTFEDVQPTWARALVLPEQYERLLAMGCGSRCFIGTAEIVPPSGARRWGGRWMSYSNLVTFMNNTASTYSSICRLHNIGTSTDGRAIYVHGNHG